MVQVFVAIPFSRHFYPVYETIRAVCLGNGARSVRVDEVVGAGDIYQLIEREIVRAELVIADCTGDPESGSTNPNVALEVGLARALRKSVILLAQNVEALPFDLRTQRALCYENTNEGLLDLGYRLRIVVEAALRKAHFDTEEASEPTLRAQGPEEPYLYVRQNDLGFEEYLSPRDGREMVLIPDGEFPSGPDRKAVRMPAFLIDKFPVTNLDYARFMDATGHPPPYFWDWGEPVGSDEPVVGVSWHDAYAYCRWAGKELPRSLEWEKAAGGPDGREFPWGDEDPDPGKAAYRSLEGRGPARPCPVGRSSDGISPYGCYDLSGNVWEWLEEWREAGRTRLIAGGSVYSEPWALRCSSRFWSDPTRADYPAIGFRGVRRPR